MSPRSGERDRGGRRYRGLKIPTGASNDPGPRILVHRMALESSILDQGTRVRVTQQVPQTNGVWSTTCEGLVLRYRQAQTGSWYAHAKDDRLWLDRLEIELDSGEITTLNLDHYTLIEDLSDPSETPAPRNPTELELDDRHRP